MTETTPADSPPATAYQTPTKTPGGTTAQLPFKQATPKHGGIAEIQCLKTTKGHTTWLPTKGSLAGLGICYLTGTGSGTW